MKKKILLTVILLFLAGRVFAGLTINPVTGKIDFTSSSILYDAINNPDGNAATNFSSFTNTWTSAINGTFFTISGSTAGVVFEGPLTVQGQSVCQEDGTDCPAGIGATAVTDIGDADADGETDMSTFTHVWTSTADGDATMIFHNTTASPGAETSLVDFKYAADGNTNAYWWRAYDNNNDVRYKLGPSGLEGPTGEETVIQLTEGDGTITTDANKVGLAVDGTNRLFARHESDGNKYFIDEWTKTISIVSPTDTDDFYFQVPYAVTLTNISCLVDPADTGENMVIALQECDNTADNCAAVDSNITCDNDGATDDGSLSNPSIDADDFMFVSIVSTSGTISMGTILVEGYK